MSLITLSNINKEYPGKWALKNINWELKKGIIHGLLGQNGAGKTTLMKILAGLIAPTSGQVVFNQKNLTLGLLLENPPLYMDMRVNEYLKFVAHIQGLYGKKAKLAAAETLVKVGLDKIDKQLVGTLSRGQKQKLAVGQALVHKPDILILDEPTIGLDPIAVMEIRDLMQNLKGEHTVLFSTHILSEVEEIGDVFSIIHHGELLHTGPLKDIGPDAKLEHFFKLTLAQNQKQNNEQKQLASEMNL